MRMKMAWFTILEMLMLPVLRTVARFVEVINFHNYLILIDFSKLLSLTIYFVPFAVRVWSHWNNRPERLPGM